MGDEAFSIKQVRGDIEKLSRQLEKEARKKIRAEVRRTLTAETKTIRAAVKKSAKDNLPKRGGLNKFAAVTPGIKTALFSGDTASAGISMKKAGHDLEALDKGEFRHPVHGRKVWVLQTLDPAGFFTDAVKDDAELKRRVEAALRKAIDNL
jgi:hypothetical protein